MITYLDRATIGVTQESMHEASALTASPTSTGRSSAFSLAYALFEVPTGWLGDVFGPRRTLIRIVLWWSFFTALTGLAGFRSAASCSSPFAGLVAVHFLFGVGEAGAYPNITRALHNWFPPQERGLTQGFVWMSGRLMGGLTALIWMLLVVRDRPVTGGRPSGCSAAWASSGASSSSSVPQPAGGEGGRQPRAELALIRAGVGHETDRAHGAIPVADAPQPDAVVPLRDVFLHVLRLVFQPQLSALLPRSSSTASLKDDWSGSLYKGGAADPGGRRPACWAAS